MNVERNRRILLAEVTATFAITTRYSEYVEISSSSIRLYLSCSSFAGQGLSGVGSVGTREWYCLGPWTGSNALHLRNEAQMCPLMLMFPCKVFCRICGWGPQSECKDCPLLQTPYGEPGTWGLSAPGRAGGACEREGERWCGVLSGSQ